MANIGFTTAGGISVSGTIRTENINALFPTGIYAYAEISYDDSSGGCGGYLQLCSNPQGTDTSGYWRVDAGEGHFRFIFNGDSVPMYLDTGIHATEVGNAVWNDIADLITIPDDDTVEPGYCYAMNKSGHYTKTTKYLQPNFIGIESDTYGFGLGNNLIGQSLNKMHVAIAGYVLAYVDKEYSTGTPLTCTENGYLTVIEETDAKTNPELIIATYWKPETAELWGSESNKVKVNGRHWIKIK